MNTFGLTKTPYRGLVDTSSQTSRTSKFDLRIRSYGPGKFKQQYFISFQVSPGFLPDNNPRLYISLVLGAKLGSNPKTREKIPKTRKTPNWVVLTHFKADRVSAVGADSGYHYCTCTRQGGAPPPDDLGRKISRLTAAGRARIGSANAAAAATLGRRIFVFFGHFRPTHNSFPPFLDPLNSFPWSLFCRFLTI